MLRFTIALFMLMGLSNCSDSDVKQNTLVLSSETAEGIDSSTKVLYLGVDVGAVKEVTLLKDFKVQIVITLRDNIEIPDDAIAKLIQKEILDSYIEFEVGESKTFYNDTSEINLKVKPSLVDKIEGILKDN